MQNVIELKIAETQTEPYISFSGGRMEIIGKSIPTDSTKLYTRVIEAFYRYSRNPLDKTEIIIDLEYINSTSCRSLLNLLIVAEHIYKEGFDVAISWYHHELDELMLEQGKIFKELLSLPFNILSR